jgi:hypothetical protein
MNVLTLTLYTESQVSINIVKLYMVSSYYNWSEFIKTLDDNIVDVFVAPFYTDITFKREEHKTWFLLRWS